MSEAKTSISTKITIGINHDGWSLFSFFLDTDIRPINYEMLTLNGRSQISDYEEETLREGDEIILTR